MGAGVSGTGDIHEQRGLERAVDRARFVGAAMAFLIGPLFPNLGVPWVLALGGALLVYGTIFRLLQDRARTASQERRIAWLALGADASVVAYAMFVFSPDPGWTTFVLGVLVIVIGGFRFGGAGSLLATVTMSAAYVGVSWFRDRAFGFVLEPQRVAFHVAFFLLTALLVSGILRELHALRRQREDLHRRAVDAEAAARRALLKKASHELRTPLNAVLGFADLLREQLAGVVTDKQAGYLRNIAEAGQRLLELIDGLLELSRIESGGVELQLRDVGIDELLAPVIAHAAPSAAAQGVSFEAGPTPGGTVRLDPARIGQAAEELISSAVSTTPRGGRVALGASFEGVALVLTVEDGALSTSGDERVFEILEPRGDDIQGGDFRLAIARSIVELHGGSIEVRAGTDGARTFRLTIPRAVMPSGSARTVAPA